MADNVELSSGSGGATVRTLEDTNSIHWAAGVCAFATTVGTPDVLEVVRPAAGLPIAFNTVADGSGTEKRAITDTDGHLQIDVLSCASHAVTNAGTFAVQAAQSGTWTVDLGATDNAVLDSILSALQGTLTVGSHAVTNAGTFAVQVDGSALTALQLIDDVVYVDDADWTATTSKHSLVGGVYQSTPGTITDGDTGPLRLTANGAAHVSVQNTVTVASHAVTNGGTFAVQAEQSGTWNITNISGTVSLPTGAATAANQSTGNTALAAIQTAVETLDNAIAGSEMQVDVVSSALPSGAATAAKQPALGTAGTASADVLTIQGIASMTAIQVADNGSSLTVDNGGTFAVQPRPETSGGLTPFKTLDLDETEEEVKASAGQVYGWYFFNASTSIRYLKFYNATAANTTVGTTTPVFTIPLPAASSGGVGGNVLGAHGIAFDTAITVAATTGLADADTGAPGANEVILALFYK